MLPFLNSPGLARDLALTYKSRVPSALVAPFSLSDNFETRPQTISNVSFIIYNVDQLSRLPTLLDFSYHPHATLHAFINHLLVLYFTSQSLLTFTILYLFSVALFLYWNLQRATLDESYFCVSSMRDSFYLFNIHCFKSDVVYARCMLHLECMYVHLECMIAYVYLIYKL